MRISVGVETARHVLRDPIRSLPSPRLEVRDPIMRCHTSKRTCENKGQDDGWTINLNSFFKKRLNSCSGAATCPAVMLTPRWTPTAPLKITAAPFWYWNKTFGQFFWKRKPAHQKKRKAQADAENLHLSILNVYFKTAPSVPSGHFKTKNPTKDLKWSWLFLCPFDVSNE